MLGTGMDESMSQLRQLQLELRAGNFLNGSQCTASTHLPVPCFSTKLRTNLPGGLRNINNWCARNQAWNNQCGCEKPYFTFFRSK